MVEATTATTSAPGSWSGFPIVAASAGTGMEATMGASAGRGTAATTVTSTRTAATTVTSTRTASTVLKTAATAATDIRSAVQGDRLGVVDAGAVVFLWFL